MSRSPELAHADFPSQLKQSQLYLTKRQREILEWLRDHPEDTLIYERGRGYIDTDPVSGRTVFALLRLCAIKELFGNSFGDKNRPEHFQITGTGRELLGGIASVELKTIRESLAMRG